VAQLEGADDAVCLTCGMAAVSSALIAAGVLSGNKRILGPYSCYGSTYTLMKSRFADIAECEFVDMGDTEVSRCHHN
jgi:cystathionine beta-lyase/cystathionine gamma-synthase